MKFRCDTPTMILKKNMKFGKMGKTMTPQAAMNKETSGMTMVIFE